MKVIEFLSNGGRIFDATVTYPDWLTAQLRASVQDQLFDYSLRTIQPRLQLLAEELGEDLEDTIQRAVRLRIERNNYKYATLLATESFDYNPIENYNMTETEEVTRTKGEQEDSTVYGQAVDSVLHGHTVTQTNANTDTTTYANSDTTTHANSDTLTLNTTEDRSSSAEIDGTTSATEGARTDSENKGVYGFNSAAAVPSDTVDRTKGSQTNSGTSHSESTGTDTVTRGGTETTAHAGTVTDAHTGTVTDGHTGTITNANSGTDQTTRGSHTDTRTEGERQDGEVRELTRSGNIGVTTSQQMIQSEREVADFSFLKILTADIVNSFTLGVM